MVPAVKSEGKNTHRRDIDGLRGIAVIAVIINHLHEQWLPSGHLGVDIFFVISGYVITLSLINRIDQDLILFLADFYSRRVKRLMPALLACVLLTSVAVILLARQPQDSLATGKMALVGLANIYLYNIGTNYIGESAQKNAFLQTWSLGVEEQFYFIFPLLFWILLRRQWRMNMMGAALFFTSLSVTSLALYIERIRSDYWAAFYLLPSRFWELGLGVVSFLLIRQCGVDQPSMRWHWPKWLTNGVAPYLQSVLLAGLIAILFFDRADAGRSTLLVAVLTALIIAAGTLSQANKQLLEQPWLLWIGMISYSLYLWHWSVLYMARMLKLTINPVTTALLILAMVLLAIASYYLIENPLRQAEWGSTARLTIGKGLLGVLGGITALTIGQEFLLSWYPTQQTVQARGRDWSGQTKDKCHVERVNERSINNHISDCLPILPNQQNALIIGNSHALQYGPMIKEALPGWHVASLTMWGCSYLPKSQLSPHDINYKRCDLYGERIKSHLSQNLQKNDIVFLGYTVANGISTPMLSRYIADLAKTIKDRGARLVIFDDVYATSFEPEDCEATIPTLLGLTRKSSACNFPVQSATNYKEFAMFDLMMRNLQERHPVIYIATRDWVCPNGLCLYRQPNGFETFDYGSHLFNTTSASLGPALRKELRSRNILPGG